MLLFQGFFFSFLIFPFGWSKILWLHFKNIKKKVKSLSCVQLFATPWTIPTRLLGPWHSPGKSTGVGCHFPLQGIFPTQGSNPGLPHCKQTLYHLSHQGSSHPYMTTGKIIALTRQTFVSKVTSLVFKMLSKFVIALLIRSKFLTRPKAPSVVIWELKKIKSATVSIFFSHLFALKWWDWMPWS